MGIDLYNTEEKLRRAIKSVKALPVPKRNRELILDFLDSSLVGWNGRRKGKKRVLKYASHLKQIALLLGDTRFHHLTKRDVRRLLRAIDDEKGEWAQHDYRVVFRIFVTWMRQEHGYPEDYPDRDKHVKALEMVELGLLNHALEVSKIRVKQPDRLRPRDKIPSKEHLGHLRQTALNPRDRAFFAVCEELGPRPGGICTRQVKHVVFDDLGAQVYMDDKTLRGEPVRLTWSAGYLREWLEAHPFGDEPESPLWVKLNVVERPEPLDYAGFRAMERRARERYNRKARARGLPELAPIDLYAFRYYAQIRDELDGVPRSVQIRQRGWRYDSDMPNRYARLVAGDVDRYYKRSLGLDGEEQDDRPPRCREVNPPEVRMCKRCGLPLTEEAASQREAVNQLAIQVLRDPELREELLRALTFPGDSLGEKA
jgi:hypothetical protein